MIQENNGVFRLDTPNTTYLFHITETGHLEHLYYGQTLNEIGDLEAYRVNTKLRMPTIVNTSDRFPRSYPALTLMETSSFGKGDLREVAFAGEYGENGNTVFDFVYDSYRIEKGCALPSPLPFARRNCSSTLIIQCLDEPTGIILELHYTVFDDCDVITRSCVVCNSGSETLVIRSVSSLQLDLIDTGWEALTLDGAWSRERQICRTPLHSGIFSIQSTAGISSAEHNPLLILNRNSGSYLFNLFWSGDHRESVEVTTYGTLRLLTGINPSTFSYRLKSGECFYTPEAMMAFSPCGEEYVTQTAHFFVRQQVLPEYWSEKERPILLNSWEGMGFDLSEEKIKKQALQAKKLGIELFVIDDGWFRHKQCAVGDLGDWVVAENKFPKGLKSVVSFLHEIGLMAGIWVEPESISLESDLYRTHPEYLVQCPGREPSPGRDQYLLDLTREDVVQVLYQKLENLISDNSFDYLKWDMNRYFSDDYSPDLWMPEFRYRWTIGLYELLRKIRRRFPTLLIEGCASGGGRFDLGMLSYVDQFWGSDNTDATDRLEIFLGTSLGYPQRCFGAHVSKIPNGITGRIYDYETAFAVNAFGAYGYELDVTALTDEEKQIFIDQITFYKQFRNLLQLGTLRRVRNDDTVIWTTENEDATVILALYLEKRTCVSQPKVRTLQVPSCRREVIYRVRTRKQWITAPFPCAMKNGAHLSEVFERIVPGVILCGNGMTLMPVHLGTDMNQDTAFLGDYGSRIFIVEAMGGT
ncbi:MAG: alpha-galactosidase [Oscillospiraceae bacterium]|nr:alpha-galactosidase [Oscillospiraceae bacterium]